MVADYWLAVLRQAEEEAVEEHMSTCDQYGARLREVTSHVDGVRNREHQPQFYVADPILRMRSMEVFGDVRQHN